ncbi:MAG: stage III sporulation protein AF [Ruminococcus sp.]|uniref:hypothetical protein n=1 Tax=Ruminococcus sp. TaxID=41978 RepID=UPI00287347CB|nr:hypothetical protein [Ruminococcus sp.]MBQ3284020.1 stage III sporulation protein AF [Ruminococcus sp.]
MSGLQSVCVTLCYTCVAVGIVSLIVPQKRTRRVMSFVIGLFIISTIAASVSAQINEITIDESISTEITVPTFHEADYQRRIAQMTADNLTKALNELLQNEGINARDIQLTLKISDEGRISVVRAVIYINEADRDRTAQIESIIYRNIAKEPEIYVTGETPQ